LLFNFFQEVNVNFVRPLADNCPAPILMPELHVLSRAALLKTEFPQPPDKFARIHGY